MQDLNDLYLFAQVVEHGGFAAAGRAVGVPKSKLSRRIGALEARLGVRLLQRTTRRFAVTDLGQEYYRHCVAMLVEAEAAQDLIERTRTEPQGTIRVSCPPALVCFEVGDMITRFMAANPRVTVHLESTSRRIDPITDGIDVAIRVRFPPLEETDLVMRVLGKSEQRLVASPKCLQSVASTLVPAAVGSLPSAGFGPPKPSHVWHLKGPDGAVAEVVYRPRLVTDDIAQLRSAALAGVGVVQLPMMAVEHDIGAGRLVDILPEWQPEAGIVHAVFPSRRGLLPSVRALVDHLATEYDRTKRTDATDR
ncbi:MAG TPA: LysR substrate-binding domain-containing protein [Hyphomicrobiaceae bacterium]|nr:LysR substrate-binding domain-containing protein [Hyphomicrobiaceae bacterium]